MTVPSLERPRLTTPITAALRRLRQSEPNPVLVKELRSRFRGGRAFWTVSGFVLALTVVVWWAYSESSNLSAGFAGDFDAAVFGRELFQSIFSLELIGILIIAPALTFSAICGERERETLDLLLATPLSAWSILRGKLGAAMAYVLLLVFSALPVLSLVFFFGGVSWEDVLLSQLAVVVVGLLLTALGLLASVVSRQSGRAAMLAYAGTGLLCLGFPFLTVVLYQWYLRSPYFLLNALTVASPIALGVTVIQGGGPVTPLLLAHVWLAGALVFIAGWRLSGKLLEPRLLMFLLLWVGIGAALAVWIGNAYPNGII